MLNSTLFGGVDARAALQKAYSAGDVTDDWCVGGCQPWQQTDAGIRRYEHLRSRYYAQTGKPQRKAAGT